MEQVCPSCSEPLSKVYTDFSGGPTANTAPEKSGLAVCASCGHVLDDGGEMTGDERTELATPSTSQPPQNRVAHFLLGRLLGRGGFGAVWLAEDLNLGRRVALKLPKSLHKDAQLLHEAKTAARLKHPNIVAVYEVGTEGDQVYIASEFIDGVSLRDKMTGGRLPVDEVVRLLATIARAVQHAHDNGVVHRDLKPENIMLDERDQPFVTDFGIAKQISEIETISTDGQIIGTIAYMSPEQARGNSRDTDHRSDVYAIGTMLFEMLTEYRPFRGNARGILHQKLYEDAPSPRKLVPALPKDLETVCLKCLQREPAKRYESSADVADELERFEKNIPILARPVSRSEMLLRWCKRNRAVAGLAVSVFCSLAIGLIGISYFWRQSEQSASQRQQALYRTNMVLASNLWRRGDIDGVRNVLDKFGDGDGSPDQREFEWHYMDHALTPFVQIVDHGEAVLDVALSADGQLFASAGRDRRIRVWDSDNGQLVRTLHSVPGRVQTIDFSPLNDRLLSTHTDGSARIWHPKQHAKEATAFAHGQGLIAARFHPQGEIVLTVDQTGTAKWWDVASGEMIRQADQLGRQVRDARFSPDGEQIAIASLSGAIAMIDNDGNRLDDLVTNVRLGRIAFAQDGATLLTAGGSDRLGSTTIADGTTTITDYDGAAVGDVEYLGSTDQIAIVLANSNLMMLGPDRRRMRQLPTHALSHGVLAKSRDETLLVVGSGDGTVKLLSTERLRVPTVMWHDTNVWDVKFFGGSDRVLTSDNDGQIHLWDISSGESTALCEASGRPVLALEVRRQPATVFATGMIPRLDAFDPVTETRLQSIPLPMSGFGAISLSPDQRRLAAGSKSGTVLVIDTDAPTDSPPIEITEPDAEVTDLQFSPDGKTIAVAYSSEKVVFLDSFTGSVSATLSFDAIPQSLVYSPSGDLLVIGTQDGQLQLVDLPSGERSTIDAHQGRVSALAFFPTGNRIVSAGRDRIINLWDIESRECVGSLFGHERQVFALDVAPNGKRIASVGLRGDLRIWRVGK